MEAKEQEAYDLGYSSRLKGITAFRIGYSTLINNDCREIGQFITLVADGYNQAHYDLAAEMS